MARFASKFGGTSVASAAQLRKVQNILDADPRRTLVIPSAPGKRVSSDAKVTDLLYRCHDQATSGGDISGPLSAIRERFTEIERDLGLVTRLGEELAAFERQLRGGCSRDFAASRGEYLSGILVAALLKAEFVDPADRCKIRANGSVDPVTYTLLGARLADESKRYVVPGFYGSDEQGNVRTFSRGGSDISGAIVARAANAELYENWTDVPGLLMADPRIVTNPSPMVEVTYREIRELSYMGASVFHDEAIIPVREAGIPICIKSTNDPEAPGTRIVTKLSPIVEKETEIAGIAGKKGFSMICLEKSLMNKEVGFAHRLLGVFQRRNISVEHCPSSIDGMNVIVETAELGTQLESVLTEIRQTLEPDKIEVEPDLALLAVVGEDMARNVGIAAKVFISLRDAEVNVRVINQGASELNIIVGVAPQDFEKAVRALYASFVTPPSLH